MRIIRGRILPLTIALVALLPSCSGSSGDTSVDQPIPDASTEAGAPDASANDASDSAAPALTVRIRANTDTFAHSDGLSGQTATKVSGGIRSIKPLKGTTNKNPVVVFDGGSSSQEVSYDDKADTVVAVLAPDAIPVGHYNYARIVQTYSRYHIQGTLHAGGVHRPGSFYELLVLSDGATVDGTPRDAGYYEFEFHDAGDVVTWTGDDAPISPWSSTAGAVAAVENGEWAVYFPIDLTIQSAFASSHTLVIDVNMFKAFRWKDIAAPGYQQGVFDATDLSFEPVVRFGGNKFEMILE